MGRILVADDHDSLRRGIVRALADAQARGGRGANGNVAIEKLHEGQFDVVLSDLKMGGSDGMDVLRTAKALHPTTAVILMTAFGIDPHGGRGDEDRRLRLRAEAVRNRGDGAQGREGASSTAACKHEIEYLRHTQQDIYDFDRIVGASGALQSVLAIVKKVAKSNTTVLIRGETGTGKELIAGAIHHNSLRAARNFVKVNCAALQENLLESELFGHEKGAFTGADKQRIGRFEQADGGTLFLDEVGDMSAEHAGEDPARAAGARVRAARRHAHAARRRPRHRRDEPQPAGRWWPDGQFREDLYYRLNVVSVEMPPLRERKDDIAALATFFLRRFAGELKKKRRRALARRAEAADALQLARQHPRAGERRSSARCCWPKARLSQLDDLRIGELSTRDAVGRARRRW